MEKKTTTKKTPEVKYATENDISAITKLVNGLLDRVAKLESSKTEVAVKPVEKLVELPKEEGKLDILTGITSPAPTEWRRLVDEILGKDFGFKVEYPDGGNGFVIHIEVPKAKSNVGDAYWDAMGDKRSKVLTNNAGTSGVKEYLTLVAKNLGLDTKYPTKE